MNYQQMITFVLEIIGTIAFAASGAMVGVTRKMDLLGVIVLGVVTSVGGGMIRDIILGVRPPAVFTNPTYAGVAMLTSCVVFFTLYINKKMVSIIQSPAYEKVMKLMDSVGLGIFTVVGVNTGINYGYWFDTFLLVFLGTITGVGGGLLRDIMAGVPPYIFVKHVYASASIIGALVCVIMHRAFGAVPAMVVSSIVVVVIRSLAAHFHWNLPKVCLEETDEK